MINRTLEIMLNRHSVRKYADQPISSDDKHRLFNCAMRAPTAGNLMLYSMIEVSDQKLKDRLAVTCDNQPFIAKAPLVVLFLADYQRMFDYYLAFEADKWAEKNGMKFRSPEEGDLLLAVNDALIAAQSMVTAAESIGIGSCYIGDIMENFEEHRDMFNLPRYVFPITLLCFGHILHSEKPRRQIPRLDEKFVHFENTYKSFDDADLVHLMDKTEEWQYQGRPHVYEEGNIGCNLYKRKYAADYSIEMNRSVRAALENWKKDKNLQ
ncbi:MAG: nitroreductase family protein [Spirochaetales bacterium]|uniref:Nitroreductase family protein n=1 Tax=Candidatus Thalassospirochaeta sargassi TaxID=3119039 RepID=A0AAJ1IGT9_9SPIO|nr:nitroreductase family protein [Spirochaetales bacterium]